MAGGGACVMETAGRMRRGGAPQEARRRGRSMFSWGIIGSGQVARKFVLGLRDADAARAVLVHSRRRERAAALAHDLNIPNGAETLE